MERNEPHVARMESPPPQIDPSATAVCLGDPCDRRARKEGKTCVIGSPGLLDDAEKLDAP